MTVTKGFIHAAATTALDTRKADEGKLVTNAAGTPRLGALTDNPSIVTSDASTAPMRVAVAKCTFATQRAAGDGVAFWTNDGSVFVTITKPGSNSWYVVVWVKHNDSAAGDGTSLPEIGTTTGTAAASPTVPSIPAGALALANVLVPSTATSTQSAGVVITNVYPMTVMRGGIVPLRDSAEQTAFTAADGTMAYRLDIDAHVDRMNGAWGDPRPLIQITGGKNGAAPAGARIIQKVHYVSGVTTAGGLMSFTFPTPFPNSCAALFITSASGTGVAGVLNANTLSASGATIVFPGEATQSISFYFLAIGW